MIDRYLDDDVIKAYREAHGRGLAEMGEKEKAKLKAAADAAKAAKAAEAAIREAERAAKAASKTKGAPNARPKPAEANKPVSNPPEIGPAVPF
jgi:hypothetical protein